MKKIFPAIVFLLIIAKQTIAQDIQADGKTFQTVKKTVLNPSTEFYILKEKGKSGAKQESYIKTANQFYKIVFTETELKNFIRTGKISSLGNVEREKITDSLSIRFLSKGNKKLFFSVKNNQINIYEFIRKTDVSIKARLNNGEGPQESDEWKECMRGCNQRDKDCRAEFGPQPEYPDHYACENDMWACYGRCEEAFSRTGSGKGGNLMKYTITVNAVKVN